MPPKYRHDFEWLLKDPRQDPTRSKWPLKAGAFFNNCSILHNWFINCSQERIRVNTKRYSILRTPEYLYLLRFFKLNFLIAYILFKLHDIFDIWFMLYESNFNPIIHNVEKWPDMLLKSRALHRKICKVCLSIFQHYAWKG